MQWTSGLVWYRLPKIVTEIHHLWLYIQYCSPWILNTSRPRDQCYAVHICKRSIVGDPWPIAIHWQAASSLRVLCLTICLSVCLSLSNSPASWLKTWHIVHPIVTRITLGMAGAELNVRIRVLHSDFIAVDCIHIELKTSCLCTSISHDSLLYFTTVGTTMPYRRWPWSIWPTCHKLDYFAIFIISPFLCRNHNAI